ncbi:MAG: hypothetical protein EA425_09930 [Puniceicoccaceae bacterium]|nr:MAG: hypothetical protein EA425_09930 [Puniceicoccaceae bacterium]
MKPSLCKLHPDFHIPADTVVGEGFDAESYVAGLAALGVDLLAFFAKCHYGHAYYDTAFGNRHPGLKQNMLAAIVEACHRHELGIVVYFSVFLDTVAVEKHPDWEIRASDRRVDAGFDSGNYRPVCVNSPYLEELFIPQAVEVLQKHRVDEVLLDTMTGFKPCHCVHCREKFGGPIPENDRDPHWLEYVAWYRGCYDHFFARTAEALQAADPRVGVAFNWEWGPRRPVPPPPHITRLIADLIPTGRIASTLTRFFAGTGHPYDYMCGRFLDGLGDWENNLPTSLMYTAAATIANGGGFWLIDRQLPNGALEQRALDIMGQVFSFVQDRRRVVVDTKPVPEIAVLLSHDHLMGDRLQFFPDPAERQRRAAPFEGCSRMFQFKGRHYTAIGTEALKDDLPRYPLLILPEVHYLRATEVRRIADYVEAGGCLLITQSAGEEGLNPALLDLAGAEFEAFSPLDYHYFGDLPEPHAAAGRCALVRPRHDTRRLVKLITPLQAGDGGAKFGHGRAPAATDDGFAAVLHRSHGRGQVAYLAMPVFGEYHRRANPHVATEVLAIIDRLLPRPIARIETPAQVELVTMRRKRELIVHLVNHSGRESLLNGWYPVTEYMPVIRDLPLLIRADGRPIEAVLEPAGRTLPGASSGDDLQFRIPELEFMQSIRIPDYFD